MRGLYGKSPGVYTPLPMNRRVQSGFTLVEIIIVVLIIGLLAVVAIPAFMTARNRSRVSQFVNDLRLCIDYVEMYAMEHGDYPRDRMPRQPPDGLTDHVRRLDWREPTPVGGSWDWDHDAVGIGAGVTVIGSGVSVELLRLVDERIDDGNLTTGNFRRTAAGGHSYVVED